MCAVQCERTTNIPGFTVNFVLYFLEQYCSRIASSGTNRNVRQMHMYMDLISEFVFCEVDRRGVKKRVSFVLIFEYIITIKICYCRLVVSKIKCVHVH